MKLGEYELNKIYNMDCYEAIKKIPDKSVDLIITDPPYQFVSGGKSNSELGIRKDKSKQEIHSLDTNATKKNLLNGYTCELNETDVTIARKKYLDYVAKNGKDEESERLRVIANAIDNRTNTQFISAGFTNDLLDEYVRVMKHIYIYIWCNKKQLRQIIDYFDDLGCNIDLLTWHKTNPIPTCNNTYLSDTEYCVFAREKGCVLYGTYETKSKYYVSECNKADKDLYEHPTIKPLKIIKNLIINSSREGDIVLDTFMGSGTTAVACKELGRNFIGFELNPRFCDIANDRLKGITVAERKAKDKGIMDIFDFIGE